MIDILCNIISWLIQMGLIVLFCYLGFLLYMYMIPPEKQDEAEKKLKNFFNNFWK